MLPQYTHGCEYGYNNHALASGYVLSSSNPTGVIAVSPVSTNLVFPEPDDWELERQDIINTDRVEPGTEIATWLEAFRRLGYCVLEPSGPGLAKSEGDADPRPPQKRR